MSDIWLHIVMLGLGIFMLGFVCGIIFARGMRTGHWSLKP